VPAPVPVPGGGGGVGWGGGRVKHHPAVYCTLWSWMQLKLLCVIR
jgi:hypothetical protein